ATLSFLTDNPQSMAAALEDVQIPLSVETGGARIDKGRTFRVGAVRGNAALAVAGRKRHLFCLHIYDADAAIVEVGDGKLAAGEVQRDAVDAAELGLERGPAVAGVRRFTADAGEGVRHAGARIKDANAMVQGIGQVKQARWPDREAVHAVENGRSCQSAVAAVGGGSRAAQDRQDALRIYF